MESGFLFWFLALMALSQRFNQAFICTYNKLSQQTKWWLIVLLLGRYVHEHIFPVFVQISPLMSSVNYTFTCHADWFFCFLCRHRSTTDWTGTAAVSHLIQQSSVWRTFCTPGAETPRTCCWFTSWYVSLRRRYLKRQKSRIFVIIINFFLGCLPLLFTQTWYSRNSCELDQKCLAGYKDKLIASDSQSQIVRIKKVCRWLSLSQTMIIFFFLLHPNLDLIIVSLTTCDKTKSIFFFKNVHKHSKEGHFRTLCYLLAMQWYHSR